jgi:hypothetical protein
MALVSSTSHHTHWPSALVLKSWFANPLGFISWKQEIMLRSGLSISKDYKPFQSSIAGTQTKCASERTSEDLSVLNGDERTNDYRKLSSNWLHLIFLGR